VYVGEKEDETVVCPPKKVMRFDSVRPVQTPNVSKIIEEFENYLKEPLVMENEEEVFHSIQH
jgi:hypothetical protein